jgi:hypothetical protein
MIAAWRGVGLARASLPIVVRCEVSARPFRAWRGGPPWRGVAPAASVLELVCSCTLGDGAIQARVRPSGGGAPGAGGDQPGAMSADG